MNEELKKIITYVIDNGTKSFNWYEDGVTVFKWIIQNGNYRLNFDVDYFSNNNIDYALTLFKKNKLLKQLYFGDYLEFNYKARDKLINKIKKLELIP